MSWKFIQIEPQPARGTLRPELWDDESYIAEVKYDGFRLVGQHCGDHFRFTTRRISEVTGLYQERTLQVPHLSDVWGSARRPEPRTAVPKGLEGTVIDCEIIPSPEHLAEVREEGGGVSKAVGSIITSDPALAVRKQLERGWLRLVVFDCLWHKGKDVRNLALRHRRELASNVVYAWNNPFVSLSVASSARKRAFYDDLVEDGEEGVVLKNLAAAYGVRTAWVKVKETWTADVVIMGVIDARKMSVKKGAVRETLTKYAKRGWIGAVSVGQYRNGKLVEVSNPGRGVSGFSDAVREAITLSPGRFIGKALRIKHNGREPTGRFRHPRWDDLRSDKSPKQCTWVENET